MKKISNNQHVAGEPAACALSPPTHGAAEFRVVGIGASAGGLEALEQFLRHVPAESNLAFVIVQHLDPTHKGMMPELLQRVTTMAVFQVRERMRVKPNCVYVIPPNSDMSILHGVLHLSAPTAPRGLRLPIDYFFNTLADDMKERSIGIILSGMGSDGTSGLRAIKAMGGLTLVQEPASAKFDSMPRSAIEAGLADLVATSEELPGRLVNRLLNIHPVVVAEEPPDEQDHSALETILFLLRAKTGHDFTQYKKNTLYRRIERRMNIHQMVKIAVYARYLQDNPQEVELLFKELLIGVTSFFRDPESWQYLQDEAIPSLLASRSAGSLLRAWSAGCSTGEEAYSLVITFKEVIEKIAPNGNFKLQVFATDLDSDAIAKARNGFYPATIAADVSPHRLQRFFIKVDGGYRISSEIREMVTFATHNIGMHPPFTRLDILICRNLLIYLTPDQQNKLFPIFHYSLNADGILFIGSSENISVYTDLFTPLNIKARLFKSRKTVIPLEPVLFPVSLARTTRETAKEIHMAKPAANLQALAENHLLQYFSPPAVLTNDKGDILYISGRTGNYLEPAAGKANWNIFAMAREELRFELGTAFQKALRLRETITVTGIKASETHTVNITVQTLNEPEQLQGMVMIVFTDVTAYCAKKKAAQR